MRDRRAYIVLILFLCTIVGGYMASSGMRRTDAKPPSLSEQSVTQPTTSPTSWQLKNDGEDEVLVGNVETGQTKITEADWKAGLASVTKAENEVFIKPDPTKVADFMVQSCACYKETVTQITNLQKKGHHVAGENIVITGSSLIREPKPNQVHLLVSLEGKGYGTVDAKGNAIETGPSGIFEPFEYILEKGSDGRWRIADRHT